MPSKVEADPDLTGVDSGSFEVSTFGRGVGECVVVHLGDDKWAIVDSFRHGKSRRPIALEYLESLGVDPSRQVRLIVATHWHWDHVDGFAELAEVCSAARVFISGALHLAELCIYVGKARLIATPQKVHLEFAATIEALLRRESERKPVLAQADLPLYRSSVDGTAVALTALSPSATTMSHSAATAGDALELGAPNVVFRKEEHNRAAVVALLTGGDCGALLAADLETDSDADCGWRAAIDSSSHLVPPLPDLVKVSHHGSENGHEPRVWSDLVAGQPVGVVTHFHGGSSHLPARVQLPALQERVSALYATSRTSRSEGDAFDRTPYGRALRAQSGVPEHRPRLGQVRARRRVQSGGEWQVHCFLDAEQLF